MFKSYYLSLVSRLYACKNQIEYANEEKGKSLSQVGTLFFLKVEIHAMT